MGEGEEKKGEMKWNEEKNGNCRDVVSFLCLCCNLMCGNENIDKSPTRNQ